MIRLTSLWVILLMLPLLGHAVPLGQVTLLSGTVRLQQPQVLLEGERKSAPFPGGALQTAPDSGLSLRMEGRSQGGELGPAAYLTLVPDNETTRFQLRHGRASFRGNDRVYPLEVQVPQGVLRFQQATVRVLAAYEQTLVWVRQGTVQVQPAGQASPQLELQAGQFSVLLHRRLPTRPRPATPEQQKHFLMWEAFPEEELLTFLGLHAPLPLSATPLPFNEAVQRKEQQMFELMQRREEFEFGERDGR